jgi:hypothetical protein
MSTDAKKKTNWKRIIIWVSVPLFIILLSFLIDEPVCFYTYLNTKTLKTASFVRVGPMTFREKDDPATLLDDCRAQGLLRPGEMVQHERLPEYWILIRKQSTLLVAPKGGKYPVKLRNFLTEHHQEMMAPDYKETEEEFSARFTDFILSLNEDEKFKGALLPADTDLRARSH